ncbi:serine-rich adhesin for platelets [Aplysia californica]|uniref:Serine-rich adhesin for platelets n=1 Tax=Aplysia californica TaxID=6500 RepID=A0ABM0JBG4_APLCA|nr:serine-rich adhesin for platelets [Aplysia californica]
MCNIGDMAFEAPTQKFGYLEIKQSSKVKGRKLKSWRRRWVVLTKMSDLSSEEIVARIDIYDNEAKWRRGDSDRTTFVFEHVTHIGMATSRTRPHAFEIAERTPVLVLSGSNELESYSWILTLQQIFTPEQIESKKGVYTVEIQVNTHASKWSLSGEYSLHVSPACISLVDSQGSSVVSWGLSTLVRFNVEKHPETGVQTLLVIECGPNSPTGQSLFQFFSEEAPEILSAIRQSICLALAQKQNTRRSMPPRSRTISATVSEKSFQNLLDSHAVFPDLTRERSGSDSSSSTMYLGSPVAPNDSVASPNSPPGLESNGSVSSSPAVPFRPPRLSDAGLGRANSELEALDESEEHIGFADVQVSRADSGGKEQPSMSHHQNTTERVRKRKEDHGYSVIRDAKSNGPQRPARRITIGSAPQELASHSFESTTEEFASENLTRAEKDSDDISNVDSAISSMTLSSPLSRHGSISELHHYQELKHVTKQEETPTFGKLNKRRSSSTSDLQSLWKLQRPDSKFENVYEELDQFRNSRSKSKKSKSPEIPPALPARPVSMSFSTQQNAQPGRSESKKKRPFFKRGRSSTLSDMEPQHAKKKCRCDESKDGRCVCGGNVSQPATNPSMASKSSSTEDVVASGSSSLSDLYMSIPDIATTTTTTKRRRSSDITQRKSWEFDLNMEEGARKSNSLPRHVKKLGNDSSACSGIQSSSSQAQLIDLSDPSDDEQTSRSRAVPASVISKSSDPLMSFFFDDTSFDSNPMVTGELSTSTTASTLSAELLSLSPVSNTQPLTSTHQTTLPLPQLPVPTGAPTTNVFIPPSHNSLLMIQNTMTCAPSIIHQNGQIPQTLTSTLNFGQFNNTTTPHASVDPFRGGVFQTFTVTSPTNNILTSSNDSKISVQTVNHETVYTAMLPKLNPQHLSPWATFSNDPPSPLALTESPMLKNGNSQFGIPTPKMTRSPSEDTYVSPTDVQSFQSLC